MIHRLLCFFLLVGCTDHKVDACVERIKTGVLLINMAPEGVTPQNVREYCSKLKERG